jgi:tRNA-binding EMAP/Myf-like protein
MITDRSDPQGRACRSLRDRTNMSDFATAPIKPTITIAELDKIDIRVGTIAVVEFVETSEKLVKLTVEFGDRRRSVLASLRNERADPKGDSRDARRSSS